MQDGQGQRTNIAGRGFMRGYGIANQYQVTTNTINSIAGNPITGETGWGKGALFTNCVNPSLGNYLWVNTGTTTSAVWTNIL